MSGTIVVTGAASGIGRAVLVELALAGHEVLGLDIDQSGLRDACAAVAGTKTIALDLGDEKATRDALESAGELAAVVHCAALFPQLSFAESGLCDLDRIFAVNFRAAFVLTKAAARLMAKGGSIVLLTSGAGRIEVARDPFQRPFALYGASKAALDRWALGVAPELAENGIALTILTPGAFVRTLGTARIDPGEISEIAPEQVGKAVAWLVREPRTGLAGQRLSAAEFGTHWGERPISSS